VWWLIALYREVSFYGTYRRVRIELNASASLLIGGLAFENQLPLRQKNREQMYVFKSTESTEPSRDGADNT